MNKPNVVIAYALWLGLLILAFLVANQVYVAIIYLTTEVIDTGRFYTFGWTLRTVSAFARFYLFLLGLALMFWLGITEHLLVKARSSRVMWLWTGRLLTTLVAIFLLATLALFLFG